MYKPLRLNNTTFRWSVALCGKLLSPSALGVDPPQKFGLTFFRAQVPLQEKKCDKSAMDFWVGEK